MRITLRLFLLVIAMVFFLLAGLGIPEAPRIKYIGWGLFLWTLASTVTF